MEVPDAASLDITGALTIDAWIRLASVRMGTWQIILIKDSETDQGMYHPYHLSVASNKLFFAVGDGGRYWQVVSSTPLLAETWYHIAAVRDGTDILLYIDGALDASAQGPSKPLYSHDMPLKIGRTRQRGIWYYPFDGLMDEIELFNRGLSAEEIEAIHDAGSAGKCKP